MDQPEEAEILPGMSAMVEARGSVNADMALSAILIPAIAVMNEAGGKNIVWLLEEDRKTVRKQEVTTGRLEGSNNILIQDGLQGGDIVIVAGLTQLEEGMQVRPWGKQREGK
jgi:multidrug efflux pump subunit AcrA (membrane-fusion protein)